MVQRTSLPFSREQTVYAMAIISAQQEMDVESPCYLCGAVLPDLDPEPRLASAGVDGGKVLRCPAG